MHGVLAPSFENGADVWFAHLRGEFAIYQTRSSLNICRQMALFEMVHTLILRFANVEKWINSLNLSTPIFRTLQYLYYTSPVVAKTSYLLGDILVTKASLGKYSSSNIY